MTTISAALVKQLRDATNVGMMECKAALTEAGGDMDAAVRLLRERGVALANKKADRTANEGLIAAEILLGGKRGVMIEVNCETDFVARNESFRDFVAELLEKAKTVDGSLAEACKDELTAKVAEIGENLIISRNDRYDVEGTGTVASYIHFDKIGVLVEVGCEDDTSLEHDTFKEVVKDVTLHIAASKPEYLSPDDVPADVVTAEREIFAKQAEGKPANIVDKIVDGKMKKYYSQTCLLQQPFVKDGDRTVQELLDGCAKEVGDTVAIRRFLVYQIGG